MSRTQILLMLSTYGLPQLNSFILPASTSFNSALPLRARLSWWNAAPHARSRAPRLLPHYTTQVFPSRGERPHPLLDIAATTTPGDETDGGPKTSSSTSKDQSRYQRKRRRPRRHAPVEDVGGGVVGGGISNGNERGEQRATVDGSWQGAGPFVGMGNEPSPLKKPTLEDRIMFGKIMDDVLGTEQEEDLPSKLTPHLEFLLSVDVPLLTNELISQAPTGSRVQILRNAYDFMVTFLEEVADNALALQKENRALLREIIETAKIGPGEFDAKMRDLQDRFTYEFVKYLDAEVERLEQIDKSPGPGGGNEVLNVMKLVRTRVCAQVDLIMGEDVAFLTRLLSYDDRYMMRAAMRSVIAEKSHPEIVTFRKLVDMTLKDVESMDGADLVLRRKLADIATDVILLERDAQATREEIGAEKTND